MPLIWINSAAPSLAPQVPPAPASLQTVFPAIPGPHLPTYPVRHIDEPLIGVLNEPIFASKQNRSCSPSNSSTHLHLYPNSSESFEQIVK